ncbi:hypothetical protein WJX82_008207 [Trebouxia sp. C0006]
MLACCAQRYYGAAFMRGDEFVAIVSGAAGTSISLHASAAVVNQHRPASKLEQENGLKYIPAQVVVSDGAKHLASSLAVCSEDDEVLIPAPFWVSYPEIAKMAGAKPVIIDCTAQDDFLLTPAALQASTSLTPASRLLILCYPSNPTGSVYSRKDVEAIAESQSTSGLQAS